MEKRIRVSTVFERNYDARTKVVVNQGSSRSGKTYSILQLLILVKAFEQKDAIFTIVRKTLPSLKASAMRDFFEILKSEGLYDERYHNKTESTYTLNGNLIEFVSLDQPQKKRGAKRTYLFINEANELSLEDWVQLSIRTEKQIFLDYNPSMEEHWIYDVVLPRPDCTFIQSTYLDNKEFLPEEVVKEIVFFLSTQLQRLKLLGVCDVIIDPGFGFGKTATHNYELLNHLDAFKIFELPVLVGLSRKAMIWKELGISPDDSLNGTTVLNTMALIGGCDILRVHDVKEAVQAIGLFNKTKSVSND